MYEKKRRHSISPLQIFAVFWEYKDLFLQLTKRDIIGRYRGSILGILWSVFNPLLLLSVYTFVFGVIFKSSWEGNSENIFDFALILYTGLIVYFIFIDVVNRAPSLIVNNSIYVKKVVFPLHILPWVTAGSMIFHTCMNLAVLFVFYFLVNFYLNWTIIFLPIILIPFILLSVGISWFLSSLGVYVKDTTHVIGILVMVLLFISPIFYPMSSLPESIRDFILLNPLSFIIEEARSVIIWGELPNWYGLSIYYLVSFIVAWLGFISFQKMKKGFADVI